MARYISYPKVECKEFDGYYYPTDDSGTPGEMEKGMVEGTWFLKLPDPLEHLRGVSITEHPDGTGETDGIYLDYLILEAHVVLDATIDCDTGGFTDRFTLAVVRHDDAVEELEGMIATACDWMAENYPGREDYEEMPGWVVVNELRKELASREARLSGKEA